jgi:hypothetical protein
MRSHACPSTARHVLDTQLSNGLQHRACSAGFEAADWCGSSIRLARSMAKKTEPVDDLLDALVWMRRKAKRHEAVDDLIDALVGMRRKAKKKVAKQHRSTKVAEQQRSMKRRKKPRR